MDFYGWHGKCNIKNSSSEENKVRRYKEMKNNRGLHANAGEMAKKGLYTGIGAGLVLFALIGLLPGSFIGGVVGLTIAGGIFGLPVSASVLPRLIVAVSMIFGVMLAGLVFVVGGALLGWLTGHVIDAVRESRTTAAEHTVKSN